MTVKYNDIADKLETGDLVLFSGATSSGAIIKLFDNAEFSHIGLVCARLCHYIREIFSLKMSVVPIAYTK